MKLTKQKESEALKLYHLYWDSYSKGDWETFASTLDEAYDMIGTAENEVARNKAEGIDYFKAQMQEIGEKTEFRNRQITAKPLKDMVLINETCDIHVLGEPDLPAERQEWTFYSKIRISTLLHETDSGWKIIQQHGSLPDMRVQEGETIAIDKISRENIELRDAVKRRTAELENKNRELEIEAAVERVRTQSMTIQHSDDLHKVTEELHHQLNKLSIDGLAGTTIYLVDANDIVEAWDLSSPGNIGTPGSYSATYDAKKYPVSGGWVKEWRTTDKNLFEKEFPKETLLKAVEEWKEILPEIAVMFENAISSGQLTHQWGIGGRLSKGLLAADLIKPPTEDIKNIVSKMAGAFNLAYQRFEDLQKAEAQAREAQIEAALEKVRSRSLAMQKSDELLVVIIELSNQLQQLNVRFDFVSFGVVGPENEIDFWMAGEGYTQPELYHMPYFDHFVTNSLLEDQKKGLRFSESTFNQEDTREWMGVLYENNPHSKMLADTKDHTLTGPGMVRASVILKNICVFMGNFRLKPHSKEQNALLIRFANAFEQAYTRFLDLQKAEAQARESQIEVALERVRSKSLAMHKTAELQSVIHTVHQELLNLNLSISGGSFIVINREIENDLLCWGSGGTIDTSDIVHIPHFEKPFYTQLLNKIKSDPGFFTEEYTNQEKIEFFSFLFQQEPWSKLSAKEKKNTLSAPGGYTRSCAVSKHTSIFIINHFGEKFSEAENAILKRFGKVFEQSYTRFLDLQKAEAQAREAQIEAALEKVRSRSLAMHSSDELADASLVLDEQVRALGIETWGCAFHIYADDPEGDYEWFSSANGNLPFYKTPREKFFLDFYEKGQRGETFHIEEFAGEDCKAHYDFLKTLPVAGDALKALEKSGIPLPNYQIDHIAFFSHGYILFITYQPVPEAHEIFQRFARVFEQTYTRFIDLQKLEAQALRAENDLIAINTARHKAEAALIELKATQAQLIQSEKMASLGELTAGIAHEIQNPLNFVNNFSEVSNELIQEIKEEREKKQEDRDEALVTEILDDITQNLEKINHHGKRADAIVKGMLAHSRSSSGEKVPTDINALADEYLRLSYHGLRAKDKNFNADFSTDFDPNLAKIEVIPQDIGRVLLNLINNAFQAVQEVENPKIMVATKSTVSGIQISVSDNGNGIPEQIRDKIFQPFFTTKPTGQGTGLGLSLAYDIVKAHGGSIKIESNENEGLSAGEAGTEFTIQLPI